MRNALERFQALPVLPAAGEVGVLRRLSQAPVIHDTEGRPLCEGHARNASSSTWWSEPASGAVVREAATFEYATCPYHDAREGHARPMNASALAQITAHWDDVTGFLAWLAGEHANLPQLGGAPTDSIVLYQRASLAFAIPLCAFVKDPALCMDPTIASAWKASLGFQPVAQRLLVDRLVQDPVEISGDEVYQRALRTGALIGRREVCAGSPRMIVSAADALLGRARVSGDRLARARRLGESLGDPASWMRVAAAYANHWLYDTGVLLIASMLDEDVRATRARSFPSAAADRQRLVEPLRDASIGVTDAEALWEDLLDVVAGEGDPGSRMRWLDAVQHQTFATLESRLRADLSLPPLAPAIRDSLCFVDLGSATWSDEVREGRARRLCGLAGAMHLERRVATRLVSLARGIQAGSPLQPAGATAELVAAYVRFAREVARIDGAPVALASAEALAADAATALRGLAASICFAPTRGLVDQLAGEPSADEPARALPGDAAAWFERLERFADRRELRVLAQVAAEGPVVGWLAEHVATHATARIDSVAAAAARYGVAVVGGDSAEQLLARAQACWPCVSEADGVLIVLVPGDPHAEAGCPFRPAGASIERVGGTWFVRKGSASREARPIHVLRGSHGDNPLVGLRFRVESGENRSAAIARGDEPGDNAAMSDRDDHDESRRQIARRERRDAGDRSARVATRLMKLPESALGNLDVDEELRDAIARARAVTSPIARRRAERTLAGDLRGADLDALETCLANVQATGAAESRLLHLAEQWRARFIKEGSAAAAEFPGGATDPLPALIHQARREHDTGKPPGAARALFRHVIAALKARPPAASTSASADDRDDEDD